MIMPFSVNVNDYVHPFDEEARRNLEAIPGFSLAVKTFLKLGYEKMLHGTNMASKIRLSSTQIKDIYELLPPICEELGIVEPELYLEMNPAPNAYTFGDSIVSITLTSGLLQYLNTEEIKAVIAHECAHIACRHVLYNTMANLLLNGTSGILGTLSIPIKLGLLYWSRRAELSCDRAAAIVTNGSEQIINTMIRLSGGPKEITDLVNIEEYANQAIYYDKLLESKWDNLLQSCAIMNLDHPFTTVRVHEILKWTKENTFKTIMENKKIENEGLKCEQCGNPISSSWIFCKNCGTKLR